MGSTHGHGPEKACRGLLAGLVGEHSSAAILIFDRVWPIVDPFSRTKAIRHRVSL